MTTKINQKEYLKKYLSSSKSDKKKKKKSHKSGDKSNIRIIDDDVDISKLQHLSELDFDAYAVGEDAPQIVGIVDDRPPELVAKEDYNSSNKWKVLTTLDGSLQIENGSSSSSQKMTSTNFKLGNRKKSFDESPPRRRNPNVDDSQRGNHSFDNSPPRRITKRNNDDSSPPRRNKSGRGSNEERRSFDNSPPRRVNKKNNDDSSPPRRNKSGRSSNDDRRHFDNSPPRRINKESNNRSPSPSTIRRRRYSSDESPPRRAKQNNNSDNVPRRNNVKIENDISPPRRKERSSIEQNRSPTKYRKNDLSPPRNRQKNSDASPPTRRRRPYEEPKLIKSEDDQQKRPNKMSRWSRDRSYSSPPPAESSASSSTSKLTKTLDGKVAGLQNAKSLRMENDMFRKKEAKMFSQMSDDYSGRNAEAVVRDRRTGRIRDTQAEMEKEIEKHQKEQERKAVYDRWGKGVKQVEEYQERLQSDAHEVNKPLARYADDADLDELLKRQERTGDPMLEYIKSKEKKSESGKPAKPIYQGNYEENRFGIRPGYRWDGVDRSNSYETKYFEVQNKKKASEEEAYKYSVEDM